MTCLGILAGVQLVACLAAFYLLYRCNRRNRTLARERMDWIIKANVQRAKAEAYAYIRQGSRFIKPDPSFWLD